MKKRDPIDLPLGKRFAALALAALLLLSALPVSAAAAESAASPGGVDLAPAEKESLITLVPGVYAANNELMLQLRPGVDAEAIARIEKNTAPPLRAA